MSNFAELVQVKGCHGAIVGQTGTGKTVLSKYLLPQTGRVCVIDPKRRYAYPGLEVFNSYERILAKKPERFIFRPDPSELTNTLAYDRVYEFIYRRGDTFCYTDELVGVMRGNGYPHYLQVCYCMGREIGMTMLSTFQRPAFIPGFLTSECENFYAFTLVKKKDIERIQEFAPLYNPPLPDKHTFLFSNVYSPEKARPVRLKIEQEVKNAS